MNRIKSTLNHFDTRYPFQTNTLRKSKKKKSMYWLIFQRYRLFNTWPSCKANSSFLILFWKALYATHYAQCTLIDSWISEQRTLVGNQLIFFFSFSHKNCWLQFVANARCKIWIRYQANHERRVKEQIKNLCCYQSQS